MNRRAFAGLTGILLVLVVLVAIAALSAQPAPKSGTVASVGSPSSVEPSGPSTAASASTSPLPSDPCHVNGVTFCALNPAVTQSTIASTICLTGWTSTVRPPSSYTSSLKVEQLAAFGYTDQNPKDYEEDHRVPLELGGAPRDASNLSPERGASPNPKDSAENSARADVCAGRMTLREEQAAFIAAWLGPYPAYRQTSEP